MELEFAWNGLQNNVHNITFTFIHLADAFIQINLDKNMEYIERVPLKTWKHVLKLVAKVHACPIHICHIYTHSI